MAERSPAPSQLAPHLRVSASTSRMAWLASVSLLPAAAYGILLFGAPAAEVLALSVLTAVLAELAVTLPRGTVTVGDGTAVLTGLLIGLFLPADAPLYVPAVAAGFGILVVKQSFGGLGRNWMNPAMAGLLFVLLSWPQGTSRFVAPAGGAVQGVVLSPLQALRVAVAGPGPHAGAPLAILAHTAYPFSDLDASVVGWINAHLLASGGGVLPAGTLDMLIGRFAGGIGSTCAPLLLLGSCLLLYRRAIRWQTPVIYVGSFALLTLAFGGLATGEGWLNGGPGFHLVCGNVLLGAFYAASDPVTTPMTGPGRWLFGAGLGVLTFLLRFFGSVGDGVAPAIVLGNCLTPLLDRWTVPRTARPEAV